MSAAPIPQGDPSPLTTGPTRWRAEHCTTHHHACDCREWEHANEIERLEIALAEALKDADELADWRAMFVALIEQGLDGIDPTFKPTPLWPNSWGQDVAYVAHCLASRQPTADIADAIKAYDAAYAKSDADPDDKISPKWRGMRAAIDALLPNAEGEHREH